MISNLTSIFDNFTKFVYAFELLGAGFRLSRFTNLLSQFPDYVALRVIRPKVEV